MKPQMRSAILLGHRWAGLTVGMVAVFLALTGLTMSFRAQLEPVVDAHLWSRAPCASRMPLDALVDKASVAHPGPAVARVETIDMQTGATVVRFSDRVGVYLDPCSGETLAERNPWGGFFAFIEQVHKFRFITENGEVTEFIGGSVAIGVFLMVCGGVALAWPATRRALKAQLRPRLDPKSRGFDLVLHRSVGTYVFAVLLVSMSAALMFTFDWAKHAVFAITGSSLPAPRPAAPPAKGMLPLERFAAQARLTIPDIRQLFITLPRKAADPVEIYALQRSAPHAYARDYLYLDPRSAAVLRYDPYEASGAGNKVYRSLQGWHTGRAGVFFQLLLVAGIAGVPVLAFTGVRNYWRTRAAAAVSKDVSVT
jgi:uncharacterized iron-regulated membrane protein